MVYRRSRELVSDDRTSVGRFPYDIASAEVFGIPARVIKTSEVTVSDVQVEKWVGVITVVFNPRHRKTSAKAAEPVSSVVDSSAYFRDPAKSLKRQLPLRSDDSREVEDMKC